MNQWIAGLQKTLDLAMGNPGSSLEKWVLAGTSFAVLWFILGKSGRMLGAKKTGPVLELIAAAVGILLPMLALTAVKLFLPPPGNPQVQLWINIGVPVAAIAVLAAPVTSFLQKTGYMAAVFSWVLGVAAAVLTILLISAAFDGFASGQRVAEKEKTHQREVGQFTK